MARRPFYHHIGITAIANPHRGGLPHQQPYRHHYSRAVQPVLRSSHHSTQHEITKRYTRPSVLCIATVLTAFIRHSSSPWWISSSAYSQGVWRHTRSLFSIRGKFATNHLSQLCFCVHAFRSWPGPHGWKKLERRGVSRGVQEEGQGPWNEPTVVRGNNTQSSTRG